MAIIHRDEVVRPRVEQVEMMIILIITIMTAPCDALYGVSINTGVAVLLDYSRLHTLTCTNLVDTVSPIFPVVLVLVVLVAPMLPAAPAADIQYLSLTHSLAVYEH